MAKEKDGNPAPEPAKPPKKAKDPVKKWTRIILLLALALLAWYLRADRVTPMTTQARVHALVVPVAPEVSGTITQVDVANNQFVEAGQVLFRIDDERYRLGVQQAQAALDQAYSSQGAASANVQAAEATLRSAQAAEERSRLDALRMRRIREEDPGALSARRLESAEASLKVAQGNVTAAEAALRAAIEQLGRPGDDNSAVQQALAGRESAQLDETRATVQAPEDGVVTGVQLDKGNFAGAGQPQMTFIATHNIWIQADLKENNLEHIDPGDRVGIVFDVLPGRVIEGTVREVGFGVDIQNPPLGKLPTIQNDKNWLRSAQRFPVLVDFELPRNERRITPIKVGSQATVVVYTGENPVTNLLARWVMAARSILTYAY
ncbi:MAG: HlyD family secretion protein [Xanthomonadales bacterium]|nr:HlyD family secretion protein [Gammaproteobacteria bacterium]MBT8051892.1 HlyD family secretion protein [Gammaproteobacteria bacterium]MBT8057757.1 HlyD family secretion protein [Gammaproteobacteria bacterium]NNJ78361.1 HlyD family secretion protein [Xanthomonadales bacterium]NNL04808.1 HlyD family secretion protein [Xanthomonadales bacterium]